MERLAAAQHGGEGLNRDTSHIHERLLRGKRHASRLAVEPQRPGAFRVRAKAFVHDRAPEPSRRAKLGDLLDEIVVHIEEEGELCTEGVHIESGVDRGLHVRDAVRQRERELLRCIRSGLADVIAADRNRVPLGHLMGAPREHVSDEAERRTGG